MTNTDPYNLRVTLFGTVTLENHRGRVAEPAGRLGQPWLLLEYLLVHRHRPVTREEVSALWAAGENASRVRLNRLREALAPLGLDGKSGLVQWTGTGYRLNPRYHLEVDEDRLIALADRVGPDPTANTALRAEAKTLLTGPYLGRSQAALWVAPARARVEQAAERLGLALPAPTQPKEHEILRKLVIQDGRVHTLSARSGQRPLAYVHQENPAWTACFQAEGLSGLLTAVARSIHRGELRTRADSKLTRAIRTALHTLGVEEFLALDEETAVRRLVALTQDLLA